MAEKDAPFIAVVICTRNRPASVLRTVQMVLLNDYPRFEIVVVDQSDGAATQEALAPFSASGVKYLRMPTPGLAAGRNLAVLVEAAVRNYVLQLRGIDSTREFVARHERHMHAGQTGQE